jgi:hypothetical protein
MPVNPPGRALGRAVEHLVLTLPPKERACVLLKDVFDYTLEEIAKLLDSTVGSVKAAVNRGRSKLAALPEQRMPPQKKGRRMRRCGDVEAVTSLRRTVQSTRLGWTP